MPDILSHIAISYIIATRVLGYSLRAALFSLAGVLPDIDSALGMHRWVTHSLLILAPVAPLILWRRARVYVLIFITIYSIHIAMDILTAPTPILWPILRESVMLRLDISVEVNGGSLAIKPKIGAITSETMFTPTPVEGPLTSIVGISLAIAAVLITIMELGLGLSRNSCGGRA